MRAKEKEGVCCALDDFPCNIIYKSSTLKVKTFLSSACLLGIIIVTASAFIRISFISTFVATFSSFLKRVIEDLLRYSHHLRHRFLVTSFWQMWFFTQWIPLIWFVCVYFMEWPCSRRLNFQNCPFFSFLMKSVDQTSVLFHLLFLIYAHFRFSSMSFSSLSFYSNGNSQVDSFSIHYFCV